ncbi:MAG: hypothetical protein B6I29_04090 [Marinitoga sp. 4572_148]|nr:MAG: hypothetical protein B6I29_04090 [Marinitoga sp. 4572_148]
MKKNKIIIMFFLLLTIFSFSINLNIQAPKGALVYINNQYILTMNSSQEIISLNQGTYNIKISKFGYADYTTTLNLDNDKSLIAQLIPLASIEIESNLDKFYIEYGKNKFFINSGDILKIPINIKEISAYYDGYKSQTIQLTLKPFETKKITINFTPNGMVTFESTPTAKLYINNIFVGETPFSTILSLNKRHNIRLEKDGYLPLEREIKVTNEEPINLSFELKKGIQLYIDSSPQNALVIINGKRMGYTPNTFTVPSGNLKIILSKIGYISKELSISLDKKTEKKQLFFELYQNLRVVRFNDAEKLDFYLDGKYIGENIQYLELDGMPHIIEVVSKTDEDIFFRYIITKDSPKELILNPRLSTAVEILSPAKILAYIGNTYAFTPSSILIDTMKDTKKIDIYYANTKKSTILRKNRTQTIFLTNSNNVSAISLFTSSNYALIYIDGKYVNRCYVLGYVTTSGTHKVTFKYQNGETYDIDVNIGKYEHKVIYFSKSNLVPVKISGNKSFDIFVDDMKYNSNNLDLRLEHGVHKISLYIGQRKISERYIYIPDEGKYINLDNWY